MRHAPSSRLVITIGIATTASIIAGVKGADPRAKAIIVNAKAIPAKLFDILLFEIMNLAVCSIPSLARYQAVRFEHLRPWIQLASPS